MNWFESVPNFSEGRDAAKVQRIADAAGGIPGVAVLDSELNADHHRSVISLAGTGPELAAAVFRMIRVAVESIDLNRHHGEHPRMGAVDVVPFVPLGDASMADAVQLAEGLAERVWKELSLPVYLYAEAARIPERRDLAAVRKGGFEAIRDTIASDPSRRPDYGEPKVHPTAGVVAIGARPVLIAYNAYLNSPDVSIAKKIAHAVRARDGGLPEVKALGFEIKERGQVQVSMNLTNYRTTPMHRALDAVRKEAERYGVSVVESEIVGLVPDDALLDASEHYLQLEHFDRRAILERKLEAASREQATGLTTDSLAGFLARLAAKTPTPGGGSASALAAAMAAALGEMVVAYSLPKEGPDEDLDSVLSQLKTAHGRFLKLTEEDAAAYDEVRQARKALRSAPENAARKEASRRALLRAAAVPLETARLASELSMLLEKNKRAIKPALVSDVETALALFRAAGIGAGANVEANLVDLSPDDEEAHRIRSLLNELPRYEG